MKIAVDCRMSGKSGIGTFLDEILPFLNLKENTLLLLGFAKVPDAFPLPRQCAALPCAVKPFSFSELFFFPKELLREINGCDVYFTPYCNIPGGITIPIFCTIHDIVFLDMPEIAGWLGTKAREFFYRRAIRLSKEIFTVSEFSKSRIIEKLQCRKPIAVVYNGIPGYFEEKLIPLPKKNNTILFVGNIKKHKGLKTLLKAFSTFLQRCDTSCPPTLLIVGSRENFRTKDAAIESCLSGDVSPRIAFTGFVSNEKLHVLLSEARFLVQPSLYEGFGIPPLEALYSGTNVILSDIPVFKEIYGSLPVTFFTCGDDASLERQMEALWNNARLPGKFVSPYSYKRTASLVLNGFENIHRQKIVF